MGDDEKKIWTREQLHGGESICTMQRGTNKYCSQKGMTGLGSPRWNVWVTKDKGFIPPVRKGSEALRMQLGTNIFASQKGQTAIGANRNNTQRIVYKKGWTMDKNAETIIPSQAGSWRYANQGKGEVVIGAKRNTTCFIKGGPRGKRDYRTEEFIPFQSGTNIYASQKGMTDAPSVGAFRQIMTEIYGADFNEEQLIASAKEIPFIAGSNKFASQKLSGGFLKVRDVICKMTGGKEIPENWLLACNRDVRLQLGTNKLASQKGMTSFGQPRLEVNRPKWKQQWIEEWQSAEKEWEESGRGKLVDQQKEEMAKAEISRLSGLSSQDASAADEITETAEVEEEEE